MSNNLLHVGAREFREELAHYLDAGKTVAITKHGRTIGYYVPTSINQEAAELEVLSRGIQNLQDLLAAKGVDEEEIMREFKRRRSSKK